MIETTSPSSISWIERVSPMKAATIEARNISPFADADEQRALVPRADELLGVVVVDDDEGEVALELAVGLARRLEQVAVVVALDQVDDHLGVGLGVEDVALGLERRLQLAVVLDDPVQHDRELVLVAAGERMRVLLVDGAVGGPARVAEARSSACEPFEPASRFRTWRLPTART